MQTAKKRPNTPVFALENSRDVLELIAERHAENGKPATTYRVAKLLGADLPLVYSIAAGRRGIPRSLIPAAAALLDCEPGALLMVIAAEKEKDPDFRASLVRLARRLIPVASVAVTVGAGMLAHPVASITDCILC